MIPGSANRAAFEESLNPFFKSMEETETALKKVPEFMKASLFFVSPGEEFTDSKTYGIQTSKPLHNIVLGTTALGIRCLFQDRIKGVDEEKPKTLLTAKIVLESKLQHIFGTKKEGKPITRSGQSTSHRGNANGREPWDMYT